MKASRSFTETSEDDSIRNSGKSFLVKLGLKGVNELVLYQNSNFHWTKIILALGHYCIEPI